MHPGTPELEWLHNWLSPEARHKAGTRNNKGSEVETDKHSNITVTAKIVPFKSIALIANDYNGQTDQTT